MKRIISLFLAALFVISIGPCVIAEEVRQDSPDTRFARTFGILGDEIDTSEAITRYELAELYYNLMFGQEDNLPTEAMIPFDDVDSSRFGVVSYIYEMGIMTGTDKNKFSPDETVSVAQMLKSMICFLGYSDIAEEKGGFPLGYIKQAKNLGIIENVPADFESKITYAYALSVFKLALNTNLRYKIGQNYYDGKDYLEAYRGIKRKSVFIEADNITDLNGVNSVDEYDRIMLDSVIYKLTEETLLLKNYVGYYADIYYNDMATPEVVYYELSEYNTENIFGNDVISAESTSQGYQIYYYDAADRKKSLQIPKSAKIVYNGTLCTTYDEDVLNPFTKDMMYGSITAVDNDADGRNDILFINAYKSYVVLKVDGSTIYNKFDKSVSFNFEDFKEGEIQILNILSEPIPFDEIEEDDVLNVFEDKDGKIKKIVVTIDTLSGVIEKFVKDKKTVTINGNDLEYTEAMEKYTDFDEFKQGENVKVYFNMDGRICNFEKNDNLGLSFGYLIDAARDQSGFSSLYRMKILSAGGLVQEYTLAEKVKLNGDDSMVKDEFAFAPAMNGSSAKRQVIRYHADRTTMEINEIIYSGTDSDKDGLYMYEGFDGTTPRTSYPYKVSSYTFGGKLLVGANTIVFSVPKDEYRDEEDFYRVKTVSDVFVNDDTSTLFEAYGTKAGSPVADVLVVKKSVSESMNRDDNMILVNSVARTIDESGREVEMVDGICNGQEREIFFELGTLNGVDGGDIIFPIRQGGDGVWRNAELIFDYSEMSLTSTNPSDKFIADIRFCSGKVTAKGDSYFTVSIINTAGEESLEHYYTDKFKYAVYDANGAKNKKGTVGTAADIMDEEDYNGSASFVVVHTRRGDSKSVVIYKD